MEPKLEKHPHEPHRDYKHMTWETFLTLREWAQEMANKEGYPVYLVGSVLWKTYPRDIDVSVVIPVVAFEERFGKIPDTQDGVNNYLATNKKLGEANVPYIINVQERLRWVTRIDLKFTPDTWWNYKDRMLLAQPKTEI